LVETQLTYYHKESCTKLAVMMHELGHNFGWHHANFENIEYRDVTGYMGANTYQRLSVSDMGPFVRRWWRAGIFLHSPESVKFVGYPRKAYDGHDQWNSGWFEDRKRVVDLKRNADVGTAAGPVLQRLVSFVDYGDESMKQNDMVLLRIGDMYLQYNRAKGYNSETVLPDTVTVTEGVGLSGRSYRLAALKQGESFVNTNYTKNGPALVIQVCTIFRQPIGTMDYADISIHLEDGVQQSACPPGTGKPVRDSLLRRMDNSRQRSDQDISITGILIIFCIALILFTAVTVIVRLCCCLPCCCLIGCMQRSEDGNNAADPIEVDPERGDINKSNNVSSKSDDVTEFEDIVID
jgi:Gametolysin peptidase M11